jgi:hypothetical protein
MKKDTHERSVNGFCARHGIGRTQFYKEIHSGHLEFIKIGVRTIITPEQEAAWLERKRHAPLMPARGRGRAVQDQTAHAITKDSQPELANKVLLTAEEIVRESKSYHPHSGVYFLIYGDEVVYVGQSTNVHARVTQHVGFKTFDRWAYMYCTVDSLDSIEALYIHILRPRYNGDQVDGAKMAPLNLSELFAANSERGTQIRGRG